MNPVGHFLPKQASFIAVKNLPKFLFPVINNFLFKFVINNAAVG